MRLEEAEEPFPSAPGTAPSCLNHSFSSAPSPGHGGPCPQQQLNLLCSFSNTGRFVFTVAPVRYQSFMGPSSELLHFNHFKPFVVVVLSSLGEGPVSFRCHHHRALGLSSCLSVTQLTALYMKFSLLNHSAVLSPGWCKHSL